MRLTDLDPEFVRWEDRVITNNVVPPEFDTGTEEGAQRWRDAGYPSVPKTGPVTFLPAVATLAEAQGVEFDCPVCRNGHRIQVAFQGRGVLDHQATRDKEGRPTRWAVSGTGLADLTLSPSVDCTPGNPKCWHGHIQNGQIV